MKIATEIGSIAKHFGEEKAIEMVAKAGFDAWDFTMTKMAEVDHKTGEFTDPNHPLAGKDYLKFVRQLKKVGDDNGIPCVQSHAPFPTDFENVRNCLKKSIECVAEVGADICVVHPMKESTPEKNTEMYLELVEFAKPFGVRIAAENVYNHDGDFLIPAHCGTPESFFKQLNDINDPNFVACVDVGHASIVGKAVTPKLMIETLGNKVQALHLHDTDLIHDDHSVPFSMKIDFDSIVQALHNVNYQGYFTLEASNYIKKAPAEEVEERLIIMRDAARKLSDMFEKLKEK